MNTQKPNKVFVFDMDNTLIKTDNANNLAYFKAINMVLGVNQVIDSNKRFTRNDLKKVFPLLEQSQFEDIIVHKEMCFESYIGKTVLNQKLFEILKKHYDKKHQTILLTSSHSGRAVQLCDFYNLTPYFVQKFFREDYPDNKYVLLKSLGYDLQTVVLYENDDYSAQEAVNNGINIENIIKVDFQKA